MKKEFKTLTLNKEQISKITNVEIGEIVGIDYIQKEKSSLCKHIVVTFADNDYEHPEFLFKNEWIKENVINKIPEHVFSGISKKKFLDYVESVFLKIEKLDEIYIQAAVSFLKIKFIYGMLDVDSSVMMIKNQCIK